VLVVADKLLEQNRPTLVRVITPLATALDDETKAAQNPSSGTGLAVQKSAKIRQNAMHCWPTDQPRRPHAPRRFPVLV
jgi:hypothetical protein